MPREARVPECHPERKHEARGLCKSCYNQWRLKRDPEHKQKHRDRERERYHSDPEFRARQRERWRRRYHSDPVFRERVKEKNREYMRRRRAGETRDRVEAFDSVYERMFGERLPALNESEVTGGGVASGTPRESSSLTSEGSS